MTHKTRNTAIILAVSALVLGIWAMGRYNTPRNTTPQGRNMIGQNMQSTLPYSGTPTTISNVTTNQTTIGQTLNTIPQGTIEPMRQRATQASQLSTFDAQKATNIEKQLGSITGINNVNTIVNGNTALVSYSHKGNTSSASLMRKTVADKVKSTDKSITNVVVSDAVDFQTRISRLASDIKRNTKGKDFGTEFNNIVQSIKTSITR